jgi:tRNA(adenine34) deaminase
VVKNGQLIATGRNAPLKLSDPTAHAEIIALRAAGQSLGNYRLDGCTLYVTLEPCVMCCGAVLNARISRLVFGAKEPKTGAAGSVVDLFGSAQLNHQTQVRAEVLHDRCANLLTDFFVERRQQQRSVLTRRPFLREDALRTPEAAFAVLNECTPPSAYVSDLPNLSGLRMHYVDAGPSDGLHTWVFLHSSRGWSLNFREFLSELSASSRVVAPDLIGFGRSDKPKKEAFHKIHWHQETLLQLADRLQLARFILVLDEENFPLSLHLCEKLGPRVEGLVVLPQQKNLSSYPYPEEFYSAPFPDAGYRSGPRAFKSIAQEYFKNTRKLSLISSFRSFNMLKQCLVIGDNSVNIPDVVGLSKVHLPLPENWLPHSKIQSWICERVLSYFKGF